MITINEQHLGTEATEQEARAMVEILNERGYQAEYGDKLRRDDDENANAVADEVWNDCLSQAIERASGSPTSVDEVTLYTETMLAAEIGALDYTKTGDIAVVREQFPKYLAYVQKTLKGAGVTVDLEDEASTPGACYHAKISEDIWTDYGIQGFWEWYN